MALQGLFIILAVMLTLNIVAIAKGESEAALDEAAAAIAKAEAEKVCMYVRTLVEVRYCMWWI